MMKNQDVFEAAKLNKKPNCITDHPGFAGGCLNRWALQIAWYHYKQKYGQWQLTVLNINEISILLTENWQDGGGDF